MDTCCRGGAVSSAEHRSVTGTLRGRGECCDHTPEAGRTPGRAMNQVWEDWEGTRKLS